MMYWLADTLQATSLFLWDVQWWIMNNFIWSTIICGSLFWTIIGWRLLKKAETRDSIKSAARKYWYDA